MSGADESRLYDLFVSYAHIDNQGPQAGYITALVEAIKSEFEQFAGRPLNVFFDVDDIQSMDDWQSRILTGLRQSKMMIAVVSPAYFTSDYCRLEWEVYVETELALAVPGEGIAPIYVVEHPAFENGEVARRLKPWVANLKRRQYIDWRPFWPEGIEALHRDDARQKLKSLPRQIDERIQRVSVRDASPNTVPLPSRHFVGRREELYKLREDLIQAQIGAITAVHGIAGIGKSMLAFAYAWGYGFQYPGGRFLIPAANLAELGEGVAALAEPKGVPLTDTERQQPDVALRKVKAAFESGPAALLVIDNVDDAKLLEVQTRERCLPRGDHIHVIVTSRVSPEDLPRIHCLALDALEPTDALALLQSFRAIAPPSTTAPGETESHHIAPDSVEGSAKARSADEDDEWKAALDIAHRLGGHALAVEVVGVFLRENTEITYRRFLETLARDGITLLEEEVGPEARGKLQWHTESCIARLLEPTLASLAREELRALEYAALLPADHVPIPWLRELLTEDFGTEARGRLVDPLHRCLKRLERLRLVVPIREEAPRPHAASDGDQTRDATVPNLARMHGLIQEVVKRRMIASHRQQLEERVAACAGRRGQQFKQSWGQRGAAWELMPLHSHAANLLAAGDRRGVLLSDQVSIPLRHLGRFQEDRRLLESSIALFEGRLAQAPDNADYAHDLSASFDRLGDLHRALGDGAKARQFYEQALEIAQRLYRQAPDNADYARDLWVSYVQLANVSSVTEERLLLQRAYDLLSHLIERGCYVSLEDQAFLEKLKSKLRA